jgi:hypothetical protein
LIFSEVLDFFYIFAIVGDMEHVIDGNASTLTKGLILVSLWGFDQTNADFYIVTNVAGQFATVQEIVAPEKSTGCMQGVKFPTLPVITKGPLIRRKMRGAYISLNSYSGAFPWKGDPMDVSHTH